MKKTIFRMALLAAGACLLMVACVKENPEPQPNQDNNNRSVWPEGALEFGDDTYIYKFDWYGRLYKQELLREERFLTVVYRVDKDINLPEGFCPVAPLDYDEQDSPGTGVSMLTFSGMDRVDAIRQLKKIDGILAIEPVYGYGNGGQKGGIGLVEVIFQAGELAPEVENHLFNIADSLGLVRCPSPQNSFMMPVYLFHAYHSLVNSVVAANVIYESLKNDGLRITGPRLNRPILFE